ncbi:MAG: 50S ribosomal protein L18 [Candidatus Zapsychrus exili]|nr:50S ribosomal protein L18 [Candidatus Zapsychrus exili]
MKKIDKKEFKRILRHRRIRKTVSGTPDRLRLCIHRSLKNLQAQIVDDSCGKTLLGMSTLDKRCSSVKSGGNVSAAEAFGEVFAKEAQEKGIKKVCFDRGGYLFHGRVKAFADGARKGGLEF